MRTNFLAASCMSILLLCARAASAQPVPSDEKPAAPEPQQQERELDLPKSSDPGKQPFLRNFVHDEWRMLSSPFRRSSYDTPTVKKYVIPFALISTALIATDKKTSRLLAEHARSSRLERPSISAWSGIYVGGRVWRHVPLRQSDRQQTCSGNGLDITRGARAYATY